VVDMVADGMSEAEILKAYPGLRSWRPSHRSGGPPDAIRVRPVSACVPP